ncbi:MAG: methylated-DNA--[protein]-cysteine S-methyltransferase [Termitinemataceae bacterium]|nr:MAG: methylated-DNA--[protein]-cysteine S-methyltransferase [Termitinemataceae bacterium]
MYFSYLETDIACLELHANFNALTSIFFCTTKIVKKETIENKIIQQAKKELQEYFAKKRTVFSVPFEYNGTEFQNKVWTELSKIPFGKTLSYKDIAVLCGNKKASRAVGGAIHRNPIAIIIPCHRVIGSNGSLTGFAGGLDVKTELLRLERISV